MPRFYYWSKTGSKKKKSTSFGDRLRKTKQINSNSFVLLELLIRHTRNAGTCIKPSQHSEQSMEINCHLTLLNQLQKQDRKKNGKNIPRTFSFPKTWNYDNVWASASVTACIFNNAILPANSFFFLSLHLRFRCYTI